MGNIVCSNINEQDVKKLNNTISKGIRKLNINKGTLNIAELTAAITNLATSKNMTVDALFEYSNKAMVLNAVQNARDKKQREKKILEGNRIGNATVVISDKPVKKTDPQNNKDTLYIFTDNLQAYNAVNENKISNSTLIAPKTGVTIHVNGSSALMRTDSNKEVNKNALGIVTKKNAQGKDGKFLIDSGNFEDTTEDYNSFVEANKKVINRIKESLENENSKYNKVIFVKNLALDKAGLPKRFAESLQNMLSKSLGIDTQVLESKFGKGLYGLEIQPFGKSKKAKKATKKNKDNYDAKEALKSLEEERPISEEDTVNLEVKSRSILSKYYPNIEERNAVTTYISTMFSQLLTEYVEEAKQYYANANDLEGEELWIKQNINKGTEAEQRVFVLENVLIPVEDAEGNIISTEGVANAIFKNIIQDMNSIVIIDRQLRSSNPDIAKKGEENLNKLINSDNFIIREFNLEAEHNQSIGGKIAEYWSGNNKTKQLKRRIAALRSTFEPILEIDGIFSAFLNDMSFELEFNENIRISVNSFDNNAFKILIQQTTLEEEQEHESEEGTSDNRSGLGLIKYKLTNPANTLSIRMKTLLSRLYKTKNGKFVFNSLGQRVRMNSTLAYYILLDEFSKMNKSEDLDLFLEKVQNKYAWFESLVEELNKNRDLKNEFFSAMRKVMIPYGMITKAGKIKRLNRSNASEVFLEEILKNYEGHNILSKYSIYTETGECNTKNVERWNNLLYAKKKEGELKTKQNHTLYWVKQVLSSTNGKLHNVDNLIEVLNILSEESEEFKDMGLSTLLNSIGVNSLNMDLENLLPYIDRELLEDLKENEPIDSDASELEIFERVFTKDMQSRINKILEGVMHIVSSGENGFKEGDHLVDKFQSSFLMIGSSLSIASESYSLASFRYGSESRFSFSSPDFISTFVGIISNIQNIKDGDKYIEDNFGRFDFFKNANGEWYNTWLKWLYEPDVNGNYHVRENLEYLNILGMNSNEQKNTIGKINKADFKEGLILSMFAANDDEFGNKYGYFRNPLFSDTDALVLLKMPRFSGPNYKDNILNALVKNLDQEITRIIDFESGTKEGVEVMFFNDSRNNATKFNFFPEFNSRKEEIISTIESFLSDPATLSEKKNAYLKELLRELLEFRVNKFLLNINDSDKIKILEKVVEANKEKEIAEEEEEYDTKDDVEEDEKEKTLSEKQLEEANELLTEFYFNDYFGQLQFIQILGGDLAYYKNYDDYVKRCKESYSCGDRMFGLEIDESTGEVKTDAYGNPVKLTERCMYSNDLNMVSNTWTSINKLLSPENKNTVFTQVEKDILRGAIYAFKDICSTDGQSYRTLKSFRKIFKAFGGKWTDEMETAYNNIREKRYNAGDIVSLINPIKPFMFSYEAKNINGRTEKIGVQHKNSEYLISAVFQMLNTALNESPELVAINRFMDAHDIDVMHFESVVKHGFHSPFDINYNKEHFEKDSSNGIIIGDKQYNDITYKEYTKVLFSELSKGNITQEQYNNAISKYRYKNSEEAFNSLEKQFERMSEDDSIHTFPLEDMMIVQPTADHLIGKDGRGEEAVFGSQLRNIVPADLPDSFSLDLKIGNKSIHLNKEEFTLFYNTLLVDNYLDSFTQEQSKYENIRSLKSALDNIMRGNPKYGEDVRQALEITVDGNDFVMPFNSPNLSNKIGELILSSFGNAIQRQKIKGGNVVLVSNFGLSDSLKIKYKNNDPNQGFEYIPALLPAWMRDMYSDYLIENEDSTSSIDFEKIKANNDEDLLKIIGYRIPTEDKYSMMPIKIVGFMPTIAGSTIMLPSDIVTMSGTDFDIDKLFLMLKATKRETFDYSLAKRFKSWLKHKNSQSSNSIANNAILSEEFLKMASEESSLDNDNADEKKTIGRILHKIKSKTGFTDNEILKFESKSPLFKEFMEEEGEDLAFEHPKYVIKRTNPTIKEDGSLDISNTSELSEITSIKDRKDYRNNMLIDLIWGMLTSPEGTRLSMQPGNFDNVRLASRHQRILHDKKALKEFLRIYAKSIKEKGLYRTFKDLSREELETFYDTYSSVISPMDIDDYVNKHQNLMDGNDLIGMFAINSSSHYKYQFLDLSIIPDNQFDIIIPGLGKTTIDKIDAQNSPINNVRIGGICSEFQAASPDNGKDPCLGDLGANTKTASRIGFLARIGLDPITIGILNTADDLRNAAPKSIKENLKKEEVFDGDIEKVLSLIVKLRTLEKGESLDALELREAAKFAKWMDNIDVLSETLKKSNTISRVDSVNGSLAISSAEVAQQILKAEDFISLAKDPNCPIKGLDKIVDINLDITQMNPQEAREIILDSKIPRLQAVYTLGIKSAVTLSSSYLIQGNPRMLNAVKKLRDLMKKTLTYSTDTAILKSFYSELTTYLLSKDSIFASDEQSSIIDKRNYYIHDFPIKFKKFLDEKDEKGKYKHNDIRNLTFIQRLTNGHKTGIFFRNVGKISSLSRKHYSEDLESMLFSTDKETSDMAFDLLMYAYYDNGLNFGHKNFGIFFTTPFMQSIPRFIDVLKEQNGTMLSDSSIIDNYIYQFLLNHPDYIPKVGNKKVIFNKDKSSLIVTKDNFNVILSKADSTGEFLKFIRTTEGIFELESSDIVVDGMVARGIRYVKVDYNKNGLTSIRTDKKIKDKKINYTPIYDASIGYNQIEFSQLKDRGSVIDISKLEYQKKKDIKEAPTASPKDADEYSNIPSDSNVDEKMKEFKTSDDSTNNIDENELKNKVIRDQEEPSNIYSKIQKERTEPKEIPDLEQFQDTEDVSNKICISK